MKIVGRTDDGYMVTVTERELANIAGFFSESDTEWKIRTENMRNRTGHLSTGTTLPVGENYSYLRNLRIKETEARTGATVLRKLAEMIEHGLPSVLIPPTDPITIKD